MGKDSTKNINVSTDKVSGRIIARQGERLVFLENEVKELEQKLTQERSNRIDDLNDIYYLASSNSYNNEKIFLHKIAEITRDKLLEITNGIIQKPKVKEPSSYTD